MNGVKYSIGKWIRTGLQDEAQRPTLSLAQRVWLVFAIIQTRKLAELKGILCS